MNPLESIRGELVQAFELGCLGERVEAREIYHRRLKHMASHHVEAMAVSLLLTNDSEFLTWLAYQQEFDIGQRELLLYAAALGTHQWSRDPAKPLSILVHAIESNPLAPEYLLGYAKPIERSNHSAERRMAMRIGVCLNEIWCSDAWAGRWLRDAWFKQQPAMRRRWGRSWTGDDRDTLQGLLTGPCDPAEPDQERTRRWIAAFDSLCQALRLPAQAMSLQKTPENAEEDHSVTLDLGRVITRAADEIMQMRSYIKMATMNLWRLLREKHLERLKRLPHSADVFVSNMARVMRGTSAPPRRSKRKAARRKQRRLSSVA